MQEAHEIHRGGGHEMLQMGTGLADVVRPPQPTRANALSDGALDASPDGVLFSELLGLLTLAPSQQGFVLW